MGGYQVKCRGRDMHKRKKNNNIGENGKKICDIYVKKIPYCNLIESRCMLST